MASNCYAIIMAGGRGERFWPLSSELIPKPFVALLGEKTMIQHTVDRTAAFVPSGNILLVLSRHHLPVAREQLPRIPAENFIAEPMGRDTAACIGLASLHVEKRNRDASVVILPADHVIPEKEAFAGIVADAVDFLGTGNAGIVTIGIKPTRPETGYGYIEAGAQRGQVKNRVLYAVTRFVEKPDHAAAQGFLNAGTYYWNSGIFITSNTTLQDNLASCMPEFWKGMKRIRTALGTENEQEVTAREFSGFKKVSFDYGVLEKTKQVTVVPAGFEWDDVGTWNALARVFAPDAGGNVIIGRQLGRDTGGCIICNKQEGLIVTLGVRDLVIVQARGKVLVCHKDRAPLLKEIMPLLNEEER